MNLPLPPARPSLASRRLAAATVVAGLALLAACAGGGGATRPSVDAFGVPVAPGLRGYPFAASRVQTQDYFGTVVADDFTWLENPADPVTRAWIASENAYARRHLDALPVRAALRERLASLITSSANGYTALTERGGTVFALKTLPTAPRPVLVALKAVDDLASERVVFDPNADAPGGAQAIEFFRPSPDGHRVAVALSDARGSVVVHVVETATGHLLPDEVADVGAAGDVAWSAGGAGLWCTREAGAAPLVFHRLGTPTAQDRAELEGLLPRLARVRLDGTRDGRTVLAVVEDGRGGDVSLYLKTPDAKGEGAWRRIAADADGVRDAQFGDDDALWVRSVANAPRGKMLRAAPAQWRSTIAWGRLAPVTTAQEGALQRFAVAGGTLYVAEGGPGPARVRAVDARTRRGPVVALPSVGGVTALARVGRNDVVVQVSSYLEPPLWAHVGGGRARRSPMVATSDANFNDSEVLHETATSHDGTPVAIDILRRRGTRLDGRNPVLLTVAGALGEGVSPDFDATRRAWLDRGGVVAVATLRGAPEPGEAWRADGLRAKRGNGFDDFVAVAEWLVQRGYTRPDRLALRGRGDAALVAGVALTRRPDLFRAVVAESGRFDLLRLARSPAGERDTPEFGDVADRAQFEAMFAYSPLQAVRDGTAYPAVLLLAGGRDGGVDPAQSRKMAARLQQADPSGHAVLLRTDAFSGQPPQAALADAIEQATDETGFLLDEVLAAQ